MRQRTAPTKLGAANDKSDSDNIIQLGNCKIPKSAKQVRREKQNARGGGGGGEDGAREGRCGGWGRRALALRVAITNPGDLASSFANLRLMLSSNSGASTNEVGY